MYYSSAQGEKVVSGKVGHPAPIAGEKTKTRSVEFHCLMPEAST